MHISLHKHQKLLISEQNSPEDNPISELLHNIQLKYACVVKTCGFRLLPTPTHSQCAFIHSDINHRWYKIRTVIPVVLIPTVYCCTHLYISLFWTFQDISLKTIISAIDICNYYDILFNFYCCTVHFGNIYVLITNKCTYLLHI